MLSGLSSYEVFLFDLQMDILSFCLSIDFHFCLSFLDIYHIKKPINRVSLSHYDVFYFNLHTSLMVLSPNAVTFWGTVCWDFTL